MEPTAPKPSHRRRGSSRPLGPMSEHPAAHQRGRQLLLAAAAYFGIVFAVGFVLGSVRVPFFVPRFGERMAELAEMPFMLVAVVLAAGHIVRRHGSTVPSLGWFVVGAIALAFLLVAELLLAVALAGRGVGEYIATRDPVAGSVYLAMLLVFAAMPWLRHRLGSAKSAGQPHGA